MTMKKIDLYDDGIGSVELVEHMGTDLTIVNAARVSFGKHRSELNEKDKSLLNTSSIIVTRRPSSTMLLLLGSWYLCSFALNTTVIVLGLTMK